MTEPHNPFLNPQQLADWQASLQEASRNNVWCHCRKCDREWVASSTEETCQCGSRNIQYIHCWMFPDD